VLLELDETAQSLGVPVEERYATFDSHKETVNQRDDLIARLVDLRLALGDRRNLELAQNTLKTHHFHSWEGGYEIHHAWLEANERMGDLALAAKDFDAAQSYYKLAGEYPKNLEVAPRTPDLRANINWDFAKVLLAMGDRDGAAERWKQILAEQYTKPNLGRYYQALAEKALGNAAAYQSLLDAIEASARGRRDAAGHYLLALVLEEKGEKSAADAERTKALTADPQAARRALTEAEIDLARAQQ
jgi:tetratricopeptide (TPR) repeat protein